MHALDIKSEHIRERDFMWWGAFRRARSHTTQFKWLCMKLTTIYARAFLAHSPSLSFFLFLLACSVSSSLFFSSLVLTHCSIASAIQRWRWWWFIPICWFFHALIVHSTSEIIDYGGRKEREKIIEKFSKIEFGCERIPEAAKFVIKINGRVLSFSCLSNNEREI